MSQSVDQHFLFYFSCLRSVARIECFKFSHPAWDGKAYHITYTDTQGSTVIHEDGTEQYYQYVPMQVKPLSRKTDLTTGFEVTVGDLGKDIPDLLDAIEAADAMGTQVICEYRAYRSDKLDTLIDGPLVYGIDLLSRDHQASTFRVEARPMNHAGTGKLYELRAFQLEGFI